ncbi:MAG: hypothetical protein KatS3mg096_349 [Candidatus Parcubacteria bacterium]|nr:MAG: hypothetical protein KatS3mg096_349 [Candidatus Parcubacteria bacterium]
MNKFYLYLNKEDELGEIIEKIKRVKDKEIILVVPEKTKALSHSTNFELFKKEIQSLDKKIYFNTDDEKIKNLARQNKFPIFLEETEERIFDIKPPKKKKESEGEITFQPTKPKLIFNLKKFFIYFLTLFSLSILGFVGFRLFQTQAEITIETQKTLYDLNEVITLKQDQTLPDYENKILPAKYFEVDLIKTETIKTTGRVFTDEKPYLKVIFLNYLEREIPLVAGTRLSFEGNLFKTTERITIPSAKDNQPGQKSVLALPVNLKDETLKINKGADLKIVAWEESRVKTEDGSLFIDVIKAKVEEDYDYGAVTKIGSVAPQDITNVKLALEDSLKKAVASDLALKNPETFYLFEPDLVNIEITNISHNVGDKTDQISATGKATYETMKTNKKDFDDFVKNLINQEILRQEKKLIISQLRIDKIELLDFDAKRKIMTIGVKGQAILVPDLVPETLKTALQGKTIEETRDYFKIPGVDKVTIKIFPNWKEKLPSDPQKIKIVIK